MTLCLLLAGGIPLALPAVATAAADPADPPEGDDIVVTGTFRRDPRDAASPVSVLADEALDRSLRPQSAGFDRDFTATSIAGGAFWSVARA